MLVVDHRSTGTSPVVAFSKYPLGELGHGFASVCVATTYETARPQIALEFARIALSFNWPSGAGVFDFLL